MAFRELFLIAYRVAYRILGDIGDAEDAAAETIARAVVRRAQLDRAPYRAAWVTRVATNVAIDRVRQRDRKVTPAEARLGDQSDTAVLRMALAGALSALPSRQREVVVLRYLADLPEAEVATTLGIRTRDRARRSTRPRPSPLATPNPRCRGPAGADPP